MGLGDNDVLGSDVRDRAESGNAGSPSDQRVSEMNEEELAQRQLDFEAWLAEGQRLGYCSEEYEDFGYGYGPDAVTLWRPIR